MAFETKISRARFTVRDYSPSEMISISDSLRQIIFRRLDQALDVNDKPAPPLKESYAKRKKRRGRRPVRNLNLTSDTRGAIRTLSAGPNNAVLGPIEGTKQQWGAAAGKSTITYSQLLFIQNRRSLQWGVSPNDERSLMQAIDRLRSPVEVKAA